MPKYSMIALCFSTEHTHTQMFLLQIGTVKRMSVLLYRKQKGIVDRKGLCLASVNLDCILLQGAKHAKTYGKLNCNLHTSNLIAITNFVIHTKFSDLLSIVFIFRMKVFLNGTRLDA